MENLLEKWDEILLILKEEHDLSSISFRTWLQPLQLKDVDEDKKVLTVLYPSDDKMALKYIEKKFLLLLKVAVAEMTGVEYDIRLILEDQDSPRAHQQSVGEDSALNEVFERANLDSKYTFDTFVVGSSNKFAHAAALAVAESPGKVYNPLFIYGGAGLGKTHLMHSIARFILEQNPKMNVLYVTSENFTNELIESIRSGNNSVITSFRAKYREVDVLLIDDIQFIIGKESTQEEFFHTFNELYGSKKQIVISSDKPPKEIETLEERLRSRFEWGILADIGQPDYETRMAILRKKEETEGYQIDDEVIKYIASNITSNIRELEGALNKLIAMSVLDHKEISVELAEEALKDMIAPQQKKIITPEVIMETVCEHFQIQPSDVCGTRRNTEIAVPRQIIMYLCRILLDMPHKSIGSFLGKRDHSTVIHGIRKVEDEMNINPNMKTTIDVILKKMNSN